MTLIYYIPLFHTFKECEEQSNEVQEFIVLKYTCTKQFGYITI